MLLREAKWAMKNLKFKIKNIFVGILPTFLFFIFHS